MNTNTLSSLIFLLVIIAGFVAAIMLCARFIQRRGWGMRGRCIRIAFSMQFMTGMITGCIGFGGAGILFGGTFAARNANDTQAALSLGGALLFGALILTPVCHWLVLLLFRTTESRRPFATALGSAGITLAILVIIAIVFAGMLALGSM